MTDNLLRYLDTRAEASGFLIPGAVGRTLRDLFAQPERSLPGPYKIFFADEARPPVLGFPVLESAALRDLEARLDRWFQEEVVWNLNREEPREKLQLAFTSYFTQLTRLAENALVSSLLSDYHGMFWLAHSLDLSRHFSAIQKRIAAVDAAAARTQADTIKYRIFSKWAAEARQQMAMLKVRVSPVLEGDEERAMQFFRVLQENVLIFTEDFIGPDLRELRAFVTGYLHRDFAAFRDLFERLRNAVAELMRNDRVFQNVLELSDVPPGDGRATAVLLDSRLLRFLFAHPQIEPLITRDERDQFPLLARRVAEYSILHELRRGIQWMTVDSAGEITAADRRSDVAYSRTTRPVDFGRAGVVDPMVHRFGLMYDITSFTESLGRIARGGQKGEVSSYRQMVLFQRRLEKIATRHRLQFEKFLGDGAFYTTRRALGLVKAAVEIQRFYSEMRRKGFAFNKGLRVALNYGYYRLLPMKTHTDSIEQVMEFYGPGVVELSRLTTGKANKEIEEIQGFLIAHGYEATKVHEFFAPLARGVDVVDHAMHAREFHAYVNATGHLVNEGVVASAALIQELSEELSREDYSLHLLKAHWGTYIGFQPVIDGMQYIGLRMIGTVALKGLSNIEVAEVVPFTGTEVEAVPVDAEEPLLVLLRQLFHTKEDAYGAIDEKTRERQVQPELVLCSTTERLDEEPTVLLGKWDPLSDELRHSIRIPQSDLDHILGTWMGGLSTDVLQRQKPLLQRIYDRLSGSSQEPGVPLSQLRRDSTFVGYLLGEEVSKL